MANFSALIKGGLVLQGKKLERLDIGVRGDKIEALGSLEKEGAGIVINAEGKYVSPGFIDLTNHSDTHWTIFNAPRQESLLLQGITTILGGNCGASLAPLVRAQDIEGIEKWTNVRGLNLNWHKVSEFLDEVERHPLGVNFATLVGHGTLRRGVLRDANQPADKNEIKEMVFLLEEALKEGAFGLSTSLRSAHAKSAAQNELRELFGKVAEYGGLTKHHLKDEGKNILPSLAELITLGRMSRAKINFSHFKILGRQSWEYFDEALNFIESAIEEGLKITLDIFPYTKTGSLLYMLLPSWAIEGGRKQILDSLKDELLRREILDYLRSLTLHYDQMIVASVLKDQTSLGRTIAQLAQSSKLEPEEVILQLIESNELRVSIFNEAISREHLPELIKKEYALIASDGVGYDSKVEMKHDLPHPRSFGAFPRALEIFVKERKNLPWGEVLYKMSEFPAELLGLKERGKLAKGFFADIVVFDPEKIHAKDEYFSGHYQVQGIDWVLVNGKTAVKNGAVSENLSGKVIRRA